MPDPPDALEALRAALEASRAGLLAAITGLTERDFMAIVPPGPDGGESEKGAEDESVTLLLVTLGRRERLDAARARTALGIDARPEPVSGGAAPARVLPPQAIHALAGARHDTLQLLATIEASGLTGALDSRLASADDPPEATVGSLLEAIVRRETRAAERIRSARLEP